MRLPSPPTPLPQAGEGRKPAADAGLYPAFFAEITASATLAGASA